MLLLRLLTEVSWQWYVLIGALMTVVIARAAAALSPEPGEGSRLRLL